MEGYIELKPVLKGSLETGPGVGAGPGVPGEPNMEPLLPPEPGAPAGSTEEAPPGLFWFRSFSSLLHLARRLENQTCTH